MMCKWRVISMSAVLAAACALAGCSDDNDDVPESSTGAGTGTGSGTGSGTDTNARLVTLGSDEAFFDAWRAALAGEFDRYGAGNGQGQPEGAGDGQGQPAEETVDQTAGSDADASSPTAEAAPQTPTAGTSTDSASDSGADTSTGDFTTTNVQEQGVDEADLVKNDGDFLYVLQNNPYGDCEDCAADAPVPAEEADDTPPGMSDEGPDDGPVEEPGADPADTSAPFPGSAQQASAILRILDLQPDVPDAALVAEVPIETQGYPTGMFLYRQGENRSVLLSESNFGYHGSWNNSRGYSGREGAVLKMDVTNPQAVTTQRLKFDGNVVSSRLIEDRLILATRYYPDIEGLDPYAYATDEDWRAALENIDLSAALPSYTRLADGAPVPMVDPSACFVAGDVTEGNSWPDIITLAVFDADDLTLQSSVCYLGASETLYASTEAVFLATTRYQYDDDLDVPAEEGGEDGSSPDGTTTSDEPVAETSPVPPALSDPRIDTDIHQFDLNGSQLQYAGSGRVSGHLGWNALQKPFRMSESGGDLRVVTMSDNQDGSVSPVNLSVLRADGTGVLQTIGKLPNAQRPAFIGKPAEQLYASRFLGNRGYLVTFRSTDPLYVLDLSDPADPKLAGELEVDGYSEYLHPIDENYLLGVGMDAVPSPEGRGDGRDGALVQGVKVSLYNVTDPAAPTEVQSLLLGQRGSYSSALYDHRAISILPPANDRVATRVAFGIDIAGTAEPARRPEPEDASNYNDWRFNALHGIEVRTGADAGLTLTGTLVAASVNDPGNYRYGSGSERAVMVGDSVYYIYAGQVRAANWNGFDNPGPAR